MSKFESPPELEVKTHHVLLQVTVQAVGYREAAEAARKVLMSEACPQKFVVVIDGGGLTDHCAVDLSD